MLKVILVIEISLLLFTNSCKDDIITPNNEVEYLIPLTVGNKWIYRNYYYDQSGTQITTTIDTLSVTKDTVEQCEQWYYVPGLRSAGGSNESDLFTNRKNGLWIRSKYTDTTITNLLYKYPVTNREFWGTYGNDSVRVISINDTVSTPFGDFISIKYENYYEFAWTGSHEYQYFAPSIGTVLCESYYKSDVGLTYLACKKVLLKALLK